MNRYGCGDRHGSPSSRRYSRRSRSGRSHRSRRRTRNASPSTRSSSARSRAACPERTHRASTCGGTSSASATSSERATYEWTLLRLHHRRHASPERSRSAWYDQDRQPDDGAAPPGRWQLRADPFLCETDRGAGSTAPEVGQVVDVPDRCAWLVTRARGGVEVDAGSVVRRARPGGSADTLERLDDARRGGRRPEDGRRRGEPRAPGREPARRRPRDLRRQPTRYGHGRSVEAVARDPLEVNAGAARSTGRAATWTVQAAGGQQPPLPLPGERSPSVAARAAPSS